MKTLPTLAISDVRKQFCQGLPTDRFDLVGVRLEEQPILLDLGVEFVGPDSRPIVYLLVEPNSTCTEQKRIDFELTVEARCIPDAAISVRDMREQGVEHLLEDATLALIKQVARIKIERPFKFQAHVKITLSIGGFETEATCDISDLAGFLINADSPVEEGVTRQVSQFLESSQL